MLVEKHNMEFLQSQSLESGERAGPPSTFPGAPSAPLPPRIKLLVIGFAAMEHRLLNGTVLLSKRRLPRLDLLNPTECHDADVVMIDGSDPMAMQWASEQAWLEQKAVIWVDTSVAPHGHIAVKRPVQWPVLPMLLTRALEQSARKTIDPVVPPALPPSLRKSVLVVDDSLAVRAYLRSLLEQSGYTVTDANSAETGIEAAAAAPYACILMDVLMPGIDGYEACRRIKARARSGNAPPIVMLTSKSSPFDRIRGKMAGCDAYLTKPVETDHLHDVLSRWTARSPGASAAASRGFALTPQRA
jgi:two-component system, cell cycle response regulator